MLARTHNVEENVKIMKNRGLRFFGWVFFFLDTTNRGLQAFPNQRWGKSLLFRVFKQSLPRQCSRCWIIAYNFLQKKACRGRPKSWSNSSIFHSKLKLSIMLILPHKRGKYQVSKNKKNSLPILGAFAQCIGGILFFVGFFSKFARDSYFGVPWIFVNSRQGGLIFWGGSSFGG